MENKIPTAEEWIKSLYNVNSSSEVAIGGKSLTDKLIEFAKLHVKAALESAAEDISEGPSYAMQECILNAYPESNIK